MFALIGRIKRKLNKDYAKEAEMAYLSDSSDHYDLECRMRAVDRGIFRKPNNSAFSIY